MLDVRPALRWTSAALIFCSALVVIARGVGREGAREREPARSADTQRRRTRSVSRLPAALQQIDELKRQLTERGVNLENMTASLTEQRKALEEYGRRTELSTRSAALRGAAAEAAETDPARLAVEVRNNRMLIRLPVTCSSTRVRTV